MDEQVALGELAKIDDDKQLVFGWASIMTDNEGRYLLDRQNDFIDKEDELEKAAYDYVLHSRDGGEMHINKGVSTMVESIVLTKEKQEALGISGQDVPVGWWIGFKVNDAKVWDQVKKGSYSGFSVHGKGRRTPKVLAKDTYTEVGKSESKVKAVEKSEPDCIGCNDAPTISISKRLFRVMKKANDHQNNKVAYVMGEFESGKLKSSDGKKVTDRRQALAIAMSEAGISKVAGAPMPYIMPRGSSWCVYDTAGKKLAEYSTINEAKEKVNSMIGKGDFPGHPFRGNQYVKAGYRGKHMKRKTDKGVTPDKKVVRGNQYKPKMKSKKAGQAEKARVKAKEVEVKRDAKAKQLKTKQQTEAFRETVGTSFVQRPFGPQGSVAGRARARRSAEAGKKEVKRLKLKEKKARAEAKMARKSPAQKARRKVTRRRIASRKFNELQTGRKTPRKHRHFGTSPKQRRAKKEAQRRKLLERKKSQLDTNKKV